MSPFCYLPPSPVIHFSSQFLAKKAFKALSGLVVALLLTSSGLTTLSTTIAVAAYTQCSDGIDNDGNGKNDYPQDPGCTSLDDDYEGVSSSGNFITVTDEKEKVNPGGNMVYIITLKQQRDDARTVNVDFLLPNQATVVSASDGGATTTSHVRWTNVSVYKNITRTLQVQANVRPDATPGQYLVARARVEGSEATDTTLIENYVARPGTIYTLSVSDGKSYAQPGENSTYTVFVRNNSDEASSTDVRLNLPYSTYFVSNSAGGIHDSYTVTWPNINLDPGQQKQMTATVQIDPKTHDRTSITARASAGSVQATDQTNVKIGLPYNSISTSITDGRTSTRVGDTNTYTIRVTNSDATMAGTNIAVSAGLPTYGQFVSASDNGYSDGKNVRWLITQIAPKETRTFTFSVKVRSDARDGAVLTASAVADGIQGSISRDSTIVGDTVSDTSTIRPLAQTRSTNTRGDLQFRKVADRGEVFPGGKIRYTLTVKNTLDHAVNDATIVDRFDNQYMSLVSLDDPKNVLSNSNGEIVWQVPSLQPGETWQTSYILMVENNVPANAELRNIASIRGSDVRTESLTETVRTTRSVIMNDVPHTGFGTDLIFATLFALLAFGASKAHAKLYALSL